MVDSVTQGFERLVYGDLNGRDAKRTVAKFSEDHATDWAAALTYYGLLAMFPTLIASVSIVSLVFGRQQTATTLTNSLRSFVDRA